MVAVERKAPSSPVLCPLSSVLCPQNPKLRNPQNLRLSNLETFKLRNLETSKLSNILLRQYFRLVGLLVLWLARRFLRFLPLL